MHRGWKQVREGSKRGRGASEGHLTLAICSMIGHLTLAICCMIGHLTLARTLITFH